MLRDEKVEGVEGGEAAEGGGEMFREVEGGLEKLKEIEGVEDVKVVEGVLQMGVSVGKRHFKRAVDRNLLKRRIREAYRKQKHELQATLSASGISMDIFFVYSNARISDYAEIETAMASALIVLVDKVKIIPAKH